MFATDSSFLWYSLWLLGSGMLAATVTRMWQPDNTPARWKNLGFTTKGLLLMAGVVGSSVSYLAARAFIQIDLQLGLMGVENFGAAGLRLLLDSARWAVVGALLGQLAFVADYHELRVALLDYHGAPIWIGSLVGGVVGTLRGVVVWPGLNVLQQIVGLVGGIFIGLIIGSGLGLLLGLGLRALLILRER